MKFVFLMMIIFASTSLHAGTFAGWFESVISGIKCAPLTSEDFNELDDDCLICDQKKTSFISKKKIKDYSAIIEHLFYNRESEKHITQLTCQIGTTETLIKDSTQINQIAQDISTKIPVLKELISKVNETKSRLLKKENEIKLANDRCNSSTKTYYHECISPLQISKKNADELLNIQNGLKSLIALTMASVWNGPSLTMQKFLKGLVESKSPSTPASIAQDLPSLAKNIALELNAQKREIQTSCIQYTNKVCDNYSLSEDLKREMLERSLESGSLKKLLEQKDPSAEKLYCRLNGKYIKGSDRLEKSFMIGGFALGGIASLIPKIGLMMTGEKFLSTGSKIAKAQEAFSLAGLASNLAFDYSYIHKQCFNDSNLNLAQNACPIDRLSVIKNEQQLHDARNCFLAATLVVVPSALYLSAPILKAFAEQSKVYIKTAIKLKTSDPNLIMQHDALNITTQLRTNQHHFPSLESIENASKEAESFYRKFGIQLIPAKKLVEKPALGTHSHKESELAQKLRERLSKIDIDLKTKSKNMLTSISSIKVSLDQIQFRLRPLLAQKLEQTHSIYEISKRLELEKQRAMAERNLPLIKKLETYLKEEQAKLREHESGIHALSNESYQLDRELKRQSEELRTLGLSADQLEKTIIKSKESLQNQLTLELKKIEHKVFTQKIEIELDSFLALEAKSINEREALNNAKRQGHLKVYTLKEVPKPIGYPTLSTPFLLHPKLRAYYERLKKLGVEIVLDAPLTKSAYYNFQTKTIHINPKMEFSFFEHEYTHALYDHYIAPLIIGSNRIEQTMILGPFKNGTSLFKSMSPEGIKAIGEKNITYLEGLLKKYHKDSTLDESLATRKQLEGVGWHPLSPAFYLPKWYGAHHRTMELIEKIKTNPHSDDVFKELEKQMAQLSLNYRLYLGLNSSTKALEKELKELAIAAKNGNGAMILSLSNSIRHLAKPPEKDMANLFINDQGEVIKVTIDPQSGFESFEYISSL